MMILLLLQYLYLGLARDSVLTVVSYVGCIGGENIDPDKSTSPLMHFHPSETQDFVGTGAWKSPLP